MDVRVTERTSSPSQVCEIILGSRSRRVKLPGIRVQGRIEVNVRKRVHQERPGGDDLVIDVHLRAQVPSHRDMRLRYAERFVDEHVKNRCLIFPRGEGDRRQRGGRGTAR